METCLPGRFFIVWDRSPAAYQLAVYSQIAER